MTNEMPFNHPASPSDVHGTSWVLNSAATGRTERQSRAMAVRMGQTMQPLPQVTLPLQLNDSQAFADEVGRDLHRNVGRDMLVNGVLAAVLIRAAQRRAR